MQKLRILSILCIISILLISPNLGSSNIDETAHNKELNKIYSLKTKCFSLKDIVLRKGV